MSKHLCWRKPFGFCPQKKFPSTSCTSFRLACSVCSLPCTRFALAVLCMEGDAPPHRQSKLPFCRTIHIARIWPCVRERRALWLVTATAPNYRAPDRQCGQCLGADVKRQYHFECARLVDLSYTGVHSVLFEIPSAHHLENQVWFFAPFVLFHLYIWCLTFDFDILCAGQKNIRICWWLQKIWLRVVFFGKQLWVWTGRLERRLGWWECCNQCRSCGTRGRAIGGGRRDLIRGNGE